MPRISVYGPTDPWPFKNMAVGDIVICTRPRASTSAHSYGYATRKRFATRTVTNKTTGEKGVKVIRMPDNTSMITWNPTKGSRGPARKHWPFYDLALGQSWTCNEPTDVPKIEGAVNRVNKLHRRLHGKSQFMMRFKTTPQRTYGAVTVTRID